MGWTTRDSNSSGKEFFSCSKHSRQLWGPTSLLLIGYQELFPLGWSSQSIKLSTHFHLLLGLRIFLAIPVLSLYLFTVRKGTTSLISGLLGTMLRLNSVYISCQSITLSTLNYALYPVRCSCIISILIVVHRKEIYMHHIHRQQSRGPNNVAGVIFLDVPEKSDIVGRMSIHRTVRKNISYMCVCVCVWFDLVWFVQPFSHTCNNEHVNYRLQVIYYNTTYNIWTSTQYNIINNDTKFTDQLDVEYVTTSRYICVFI
jgi:hypothetical protein